MLTIYRWLLRLFPSSFRARFGGDMAEAFADRMAAARRSGRLPAARIWFRACLDVIRHGLAERRATRAARTHGSWAARSLHDAIQGLYHLRRRPALALASAATLALGVGASTAVFSVGSALFLDPLPYPEAARLVAVLETNGDTGATSNVSIANFHDWRARARTLDRAGLWTTADANLAGPDGAERVSSAEIAGDFFALVGALPVVGRPLADADAAPAEARAGLPIALSEAAWTRLFGRANDVLGRTAILDGVSRVIVGVMPAVPGLEGVEVWGPLVAGPGARARSDRAFRAVARLAPGVRREQAAAELAGISGGLAAAYPATNAGWGVTLVPLQREWARDFGPVLWLLGSVAALLMLLTCANVAGLLSSRLVERRAEFQVRLALGAPRGRVARQLLAESVMLAAAGGALGLALARLLVAPLTTVVVGERAIWVAPELSQGALAFAVFAVLATGILVGAVPAMTWHRGTAPLKATAPTPDRRTRRTRTALVTVQLAVAVLLLTATAVTLLGLLRAIRVDPGFDPAGATTFRLSPSRATYADAASLDRFHTALGERLSNLPGVTAVGAASSLPMAGSSTIRGVVANGAPIPAQGDESFVLFETTTPGFVRASGLRLVAGRDFTQADTATSRPVAVINESLARMLWPDQPAVGREILVHTDESTPREVVGVVADVRHRGLNRPLLPQYFAPFAQSPRRTMSIVVRGDDRASAGVMQGVVRAVDPAVPIYQVRRLDEMVAGSLADERMAARAVSSFGIIAMALAGLGLHTLLAGGVRERRREIGIRLAVGSSTAGIQRMFLRQALALTVVAVAIGLAAAQLVVRVVGGELPDAPAIDAITMAAVAAAVSLVGLIATWLPARAATRVDPVETLRGE